jgi:hypothetical protein
MMRCTSETNAIQRQRRRIDMKNNLLHAGSLSLLALLPLTSHSAEAVNWTQWTPIAATANHTVSPDYAQTYPVGSLPRLNGWGYRTSQTGTLTVPGSADTVTVTFTGEIMQNSCFTTASSRVTDAGEGGCPSDWWTYGLMGWVGAAYDNGRAFTSTKVPSPPSNDSVISMTGLATGVSTYTITFSKPVTNVVLAVSSLGSGVSVTSSYTFDQNFVLLSQHSSGTDFCADPTVTTGTTPQPNCLTSQGRTLYGLEGAGTIQFTGTHNSISWTIDQPEFNSGIQVGISATVPDAPVSTTAVPALTPWAQGLLALGVATAGRWMLRRRRST